MTSSRGRSKPKLVNLAACSLVTLVFLLSLSTLYVPSAAASQDVTLTLTSSKTDTYMDVDFVLHVTASEPINGPLRLLWTINGAGPYQFSAQMVDGDYERTFACESTGNWTIWFVWDGDGSYNATQSNQVTVHINSGSPPIDYTLYAIVTAVVIIAAVGLAFAYSRSRKKKQ
ncbi:MAG: hypothetical protein LUQ16_07770 [Methanomassiliicoccales archaeon]|nr:hypothetical protein [Methanomassiliicoccales archaeon]MDD1757093.1 hypothetical protein [Methanomassiliicoccales archaeon]